MPKDIVEIFTDGSCKGNPGPGGWAALLRYNGAEKILSGGEEHTTNNRMEMLAAINALEALTRPCKVVIVTDSQYLMLGITQWMKNWKKRGWRTATNTEVKNSELWQRLDGAVERHDVSWEWVKGHAVCQENLLVDGKAREAMEAFLSSRSGGSGASAGRSATRSTGTRPGRPRRTAQSASAHSKPDE